MIYATAVGVRHIIQNILQVKITTNSITMNLMK